MIAQPSDPTISPPEAKAIRDHGAGGFTIPIAFSHNDILHLAKGQEELFAIMRYSAMTVEAGCK